MILLLDKDRKPVAPIERALSLGYTRTLNELGTAKLTMATEDPQREAIDVPASWAHIWDGEEDLGLWRFAGAPDEARSPRGQVTYTLESGECTLLDDMLAGDHEVGGAEYSTRQVMAYILGRQQTALWTLGECDFTDYYEYHFCDTTLLESLLSLGETLLEPYQFVFDTTTFTVSLKRIPEVAACQIAYGRGMTGLRRSVDGRIVTRLYGRGYGEGDNQLTIASVNGGRDYIEDAAAVARYGVRCGVHVDTRQQDPATLKAHMEAILKGACRPAVSYEVDAIDLARRTGESWDYVPCGARVLVLDKDLGPVTATVTGKEKKDLLGEPGQVTYTLETRKGDTAEEINALREKIGIHELYSQGATSMYAVHGAENADSAHPMTLEFYIPTNVLRINRCLLRWKKEPYRVDFTMAAAGGASTRTSSESGGATVSAPKTTFDMVLATGRPLDAEGEPLDDVTVQLAQTTSTEGAHTHAMGHIHGVSSHTHSFSGSYTLSWAHQHSLGESGAAYTGGVRNYAAKEIEIEGTTGGRALVTSGALDASDGDTARNNTGSAGGHSHTVPAHKHNMYHVHRVSGAVKIPPMEFELGRHSHSVTLPDHTHPLTYGIANGGSTAANVAITVDGNACPADDREIDIAAYLRKNDEGKITRGAWHTVSIQPDGNARIKADLFVQQFLQSRGAGDY